MALKKKKKKIMMMMIKTMTTTTTMMVMGVSTAGCALEKHSDGTLFLGHSCVPVDLQLGLPLHDLQPAHLHV